MTVSRPSFQPPVPFFRLALFFGLLTGLGEVLLLGIKKFALGHFINQSPWIIWMTPAADAGLMLLAGLGLWAIARLFPGRVRIGHAVFVYAFIGFFALTLMAYQLHDIARVVLSAGLASVVVRVAVSQPGLRVLRVIRTGTAAIVLAIGAASAALYGYRALGESRALAGLPDAEAGLPNILLIVLDTVRAISTGLVGDEGGSAPLLQAFAKEGVTFEWAFSTAPWTLPSHASMLTGLYAHEHGADWDTPLPDTTLTLQEYLRDFGYLTGSFVANQYLSQEYGLGDGFIRVEDYRISPGELVRSTSIGRRVLAPGSLLRQVTGFHQLLGRKSARDVNDSFLAWRRDHEDRPFFAMLNYLDAHVPYLAPEPFRLARGDTATRRNPMFQWGWEWTRDDVNAEERAYEATIGYLDFELNRLLDALAERGELDNTIVVITSDHGEQFGQHGHMQHSGSLYLNSLHVPLVIHYPGGAPAGTRVDDPVTLRDLPRTILDLAGLEADTFEGRSLRRHWDRALARANAAEPVLAEVTTGIRPPEEYPRARGDMQSVILGRYHLIRNGDGTLELYDFSADPLEERNLANDPNARPILERLQRALPGKDRVGP